MDRGADRPRGGASRGEGVPWTPPQKIPVLPPNISRHKFLAFWQIFAQKYPIAIWVDLGGKNDSGPALQKSVILTSPLFGGRGVPLPPGSGHPPPTCLYVEPWFSFFKQSAQSFGQWPTREGGW